MADISREEKLASAKKKLKQFQQRRTPKSTKTIQSASLTPGSDSGPLLSPPVVDITGKDENGVQRGLLQKEDKSKQHISDKVANKENVPEAHELSGQERHVSPKTSSSHGYQENMIVNTHQVIDDLKGDVSPVEKIKQMSKQINGLISQDIIVNGSDPVIKELQGLESRNAELEQGLMSSRRSNQQLSNQVNEQRKQIIQLQEQLRKDKSDSWGKQQVEQSAMKEQLQVHIQTIGILVGEKGELQSHNASLQRKLQTKTAENDDVTNRLKAARQRIIELERNVANLQMTCERHVTAQQESGDMKEKLAKDIKRLVKDREELLQQNSELSEKLQLKVEECSALTNRVDELSSNLRKAELLAHQLSPEHELADAMDNLNKEKEELKDRLSEEHARCQRLSDEYQQIRGSYREHTEQLEKHIEALLKQVAEHELKESNLLSENEQLTFTIGKLREELEESWEKAAQREDLPIDSGDWEQDKTRLEQELDIQIQENRRLGREVLAKEDRISELETSVNRAEEKLVDRAALLESIQSDKETISRAMQQNRDLKDQLEELQEGFVRMSNANAEATNDLQNEQHVNKELATKLSNMVVELEEVKHQVAAKDSALQEALGNLEELKGNKELLSSSRDAELSALREEIVRLNERLEEQLDINDRLTHMEARAELTDRLQIELQSAQDNINQITTQNNRFREALKEEQEKVTILKEHVNQLEEELASVGQAAIREASDKSKHFIQSPTPNSLESSTDRSTDSDLEGAVDTHMAEVMDSEESESEPTEKQHSGHFASKEVLSLRMEVENLMNEREELLSELRQEREATEVEVERQREHMQLQLNQQLQLQNRQTNEYFHQLLHEQQLRLNSLEETIDLYKKQEELTDKDLNENNISYDTIKTAFRQLQARFKKVMEERASLSDRIQELEHKNLQLSIETETIGEYISLYHTQRQALKDKFLEKDRLISQLSNEHGRMQVKINQLQQLVSRILDERSGMELEKRQLQEAVNKRLALQSGSSRSTEVPKLNYSLDSIFGENTTQDNTDNYESESESTLKGLSDATLEIKADEEGNPFETPRKDSSDGTALQIRQLFEQLHTTGEGFQHGWLSPALRRREFTPCLNCSHRLLHL